MARQISNRINVPSIALNQLRTEIMTQVMEPEFRQSCADTSRFKPPLDSALKRLLIGFYDKNPVIFNSPESIQTIQHLLQRRHDRNRYRYFLVQCFPWGDDNLTPEQIDLGPFQTDAIAKLKPVRKRRFV